MNTNYLLTLFLILNSDKTIDYESFESPLNRAALIHLGVEAELMDRYSGSFAGKYYFVTDLNELQDCYQGLIGAPFSKDAQIFSVFGNCSEQINLNRCCIDRFTMMRDGLGWKPLQDDYGDIVKQLEKRKNVWYDVQRINCCSQIYWKRRALMSLKETLGNEDYYSGRIPLPVPLSCFKRMD